MAIPGRRELVPTSSVVGAVRPPSPGVPAPGTLPVLSGNRVTVLRHAWGSKIESAYGYMSAWPWVPLPDPEPTLVSALPDVHRARRTLGLVVCIVGAWGLGVAPLPGLLSNQAPDKRCTFTSSFARKSARRNPRRLRVGSY